ncbi:MAG: ribose-phosphate pyrophosphokinase, partial [Eudoraea sp.]|nr:ribose-phosphate pyrophosphokinase [Eudoraea sp.]
YEKIKNSKLEELIITDSIPSRPKSDKIKVLSCADLFADVMHRVHHNTSIASKFIM